MKRINTPEDLARLRERLCSEMEIRENSNQPDRYPQIRISMDDRSLAAGADRLESCFIDTLKERGIRGIVTKTGDLGHHEQAPVVEISLPGEPPALYGKITPQRAQELVERVIRRRESVEGIVTE